MKWAIAYTWLLSLLGVALYAHEFSYADGMRDQRMIDQRKLESCQVIISKNMYEGEK